MLLSIRNETLFTQNGAQMTHNFLLWIYILGEFVLEK